MNLKALITTFVLGSSTMASADSIKVSGSVHVSLGDAQPQPAGPVYKPVVRPAAPVVAAHDCHEPAPAPVYTPVPSRPVYQPPIHQPPAPVWQAPIYKITNTRLSRTGSSYIGAITASKIKALPRVYARNVYGFEPARRRTTHQAWFDLTEATRIDNNREFFSIGANKGLFDKLQLQALGNGSSTIKQVLVEYADGRGKTSQVFKLDQALHRGNSTITLDLDGELRSIKRIVVYGATDQGSAYKILAM